MKFPALNRRQALKRSGLALIGAWVAGALRPFKAAAQAAPGAEAEKPAIAAGAPERYNPTAHAWRMAIDVDKCIGCGLCVEACKQENNVIPKPCYFRTWVERYVIKKAEPGSDRARGEVIIDSPNGGLEGFPPTPVPKEHILKSFFVPKLCNQCEKSPCDQACPVGATFSTPDGVVLVDQDYCIGCGFCIQACPYGCRFFNPITRTANKCTLCYHRITRGLKPACAEVCPTGARVFGDLKHPVANDPLQAFMEKNKVQVLKPHLGTHPRVFYAGLDKEVG